MRRRRGMMMMMRMRMRRMRRGGGCGVLWQHDGGEDGMMWVVRMLRRMATLRRSLCVVFSGDGDGVAGLLIHSTMMTTKQDA